MVLWKAHDLKELFKHGKTSVEGIIPKKNSEYDWRVSIPVVKNVTFSRQTADKKIVASQKA